MARQGRGESENTALIQAIGGSKEPTGAVRGSDVHQKRAGIMQPDAWFFEAAGDGMHLPSPGWLVASQRSNRWRYRGGLSFGAQGGPGLRLGAAGRLCAGGSRDGDVLRGTRVGTIGRITQPSSTWAHMYAHAARR